MGNSAVFYRNRTLFEGDGIIEIWLFFLIRQLDARATPLDWIDRGFTIREWWDYQVHLGAPGVMALHLDEYLTDDRRREVMVELCQLAYSELLSYGDTLPAAWLNYNKLGGEVCYWTRDPLVAPVASFAKKFIDMISDNT